MRAIYVGSKPKNKNKSGVKWKIYFFLILLFTVLGAGLKIAAPTVVENWINRKGGNTAGHAFSVRDVELSLGKGQVILKDVKFFNPKTSSNLLEAPTVTIQLDWTELILSQTKNVSVIADKVDLFLSKDLTSELHRIQTLQLDSVDAKIGSMNIIEKKEDKSRTVLELNAVNVKVKQAEFNLTSKIADGGKLDLTGKRGTPWSITGSLKQVPPDIFNKIAGDKLPFAFTESILNAEINAHSEQGKISGVITPDIKKLNLLEERPGVPTQSIKRILNEELTFSLPFTMNDELTLIYSDTVAKLKAYRKDPAAIEEDTVSVRAAAPQVIKAEKPEKAKKPFSLGYSSGQVLIQISGSYWP